ncbi:MAG: PcfJ domain-containing protein [Marinobacter sp.]|uniref:PcfJ domain-containing protein n=1 Tax=Marinobacter sp. TaxID=50741 RepID=UPI00396EE445
MIRDVERLSGGNPEIVRQVSSRRDLQRLHDRLVKRFNEQNGEDSEAVRQAKAQALEEEHGPYPAPPVPESNRIQALKSWRNLLDEGRTMHHCVGAYDVMVAEREVFIYRMHEPERLTIALENKGDNWILGEVRGYCNANPASHSLELIHRWLKASDSA